MVLKEHSTSNNILKFQHNISYLYELILYMSFLYFKIDNYILGLLIVKGIDLVNQYLTSGNRA